MDRLFALPPRTKKTICSQPQRSGFRDRLVCADTLKKLKFPLLDYATRSITVAISEFRVALLLAYYPANQREIANYEAGVFCHSLRYRMGGLRESA